MNMTLFVLTQIVGASAILASLLPNFAQVRAEADDGTRRLTLVGRVVVGLGLVIWTAGGVAGWLQWYYTRKEQAVAEAKTQERTDSVNRSFTAVLSGVHAALQEGEHQRRLQGEALDRLDSLRAVAVAFTSQQERSLAALRHSLSIARRTADSLTSSVTLARQMAGDLRRFEVETSERSAQTLAMVERSRNPLAFIRADFGVGFSNDTPLSAAMVARLRAASRAVQGTRTDGRHGTVQRLALTRRSSRWVVVEDGNPVPLYLPAAVELRFSEARDDCVQPGRELLSTRRWLDYDSAAAVFTPSGASLLFSAQDIELRTAMNLTVDDLAGACVHVGFLGDPIIAHDPVWRATTIHDVDLEFPQGRRASVAFHRAQGGREGNAAVWIGRLVILE